MRIKSICPSVYVFYSAFIKFLSLDLFCCSLFCPFRFFYFARPWCLFLPRFQQGESISRAQKEVRHLLRIPRFWPQRHRTNATAASATQLIAQTRHQLWVMNAALAGSRATSCLPKKSMCVPSMCKSRYLFESIATSIALTHDVSNSLDHVVLLTS